MTTASNRPTGPGAWPGSWPAPRGVRLALAAASSADLAAVRAHVAGTCGAPAEVRDALVLAADELCANVVAHAYRGAPGPLTVDVASPAPSAGEVGGVGGDHRVVVIDAGPPFDPTAAATPDVAAPVAARRIGGLGIHLVRRSVDALTYARIDGHNVVTVERRVAPRSAPPPAP